MIINTPEKPSKAETKTNMCCRFCSYQWVSRVAAPKECPYCKKRNYAI